MLALQKREAAESEQRVKQLEEQRHTEHLANDELRARLKHYHMQIAAVGSQVQQYSEKHDNVLLIISRLRDNQNAGTCLCFAMSAANDVALKLPTSHAPLIPWMHVAVARREEELASAFDERFKLCKARLLASLRGSQQCMHFTLLTSFAAGEAGPAGKDSGAQAAAGRRRDKAL